MGGGLGMNQAAGNVLNNSNMPRKYYQQKYCISCGSYHDNYRVVDNMQVEVSNTGTWLSGLS